MIGQADDLLALSTVVICPTSTAAPAASFHPEIGAGRRGHRVLCEMLGAVDGRALGGQAGHLTCEELPSIDHALQLVLGLG